MNQIANGKRKQALSRLVCYHNADATPLEIYFNNQHISKLPYLNEVISLPNLKLPTGKIIIFSKGGGITGTLESARLALARFLVKFNVNNKIELVL